MDDKLCEMAYLQNITTPRKGGEMLIQQNTKENKSSMKKEYRERSEADYLS